MRWNDVSTLWELSNKPFTTWKNSFDIVPAALIVETAYEEGYINWNVFQKALKKIRTQENGTWMFEKVNVNEN